MRVLRHALLGVSLLVMMTLGLPVAAQDALPVEIVPPGEEYGGATAAEWEARWWQWALSIPADINPNFDPTGASCGIGQFGPVFLLPGVFEVSDDDSVEMVCAVPEGLGIYVSIGGAGCSSVEPPPYYGYDENSLSACAADTANALLDSQVSINGVPVDNPMQYRHVTDVYTINFVSGNFYDVEPVVALGVSDAWGFVIAPPAPGAYVIEMENTWEGMDDLPPMKFTIVVTPATVIVPEASPEASPVA